MNTFKEEVQGRLLNTRTVRAVRMAPPSLLQVEHVQKHTVPSGPAILSVFVLGLERLAMIGTKPDSEDDWKRVCMVLLDFRKQAGSSTKSS